MNFWSPKEAQHNLRKPQIESQAIKVSPEVVIVHISSDLSPDSVKSWS